VILSDRLADAALLSGGSSRPGFQDVAPVRQPVQRGSGDVADESGIWSLAGLLTLAY